MDKNNLSEQGHTGDSHIPTFVRDTLDRINADDDSLRLDETQWTGIDLYLIARFGIEAKKYMPELPENHPCDDQFHPFKSLWDGHLESKDIENQNEKMKDMAEKILENDFPTIYAEFIYIRNEEMSLRPNTGYEYNEFTGNGQQQVNNGEILIPSSVKETLDGISSGRIDPLTLDERQKTGLQLCLIAEHGIEVTGYLTELPVNYPYREQFQPFLSQMAFESHYPELFRLNEESKTVAGKIIERDFPRIHDELKQTSNPGETRELSYRWPENDDYRSNGRNQGIKF